MNQKPDNRRIARGKRAWRSSGSEASTDTTPIPTSPHLLPTPRQKSERRRELGLRRLWTAVRSASGSGTNETIDTDVEAKEFKNGPTSSLPLLQVWPSQDSPRGEADGQSFAFPVVTTPKSPHDVNIHTHDSGIESIQASPSQAAVSVCSNTSERAPISPVGGNRGWRGGLLHPDHARLLRQPGVDEQEVPTSSSLQTGGGRLSASSSTNSSLTSVHTSQRTSDPWLRDERRRSSTMTARYSLFDALDLEYALLRAAARGSVGPYSLSESLHKLTFTQSLAFPALARGLAGKRGRTPLSQTRPSTRSEPGVNAIAKIITTLVLLLVSVLVFCVVYKFVQT